MVTSLTHHAPCHPSLTHPGPSRQCSHLKREVPHALVSQAHLMWILLLASLPPKPSTQHSLLRCTPLVRSPTHPTRQPHFLHTPNLLPWSHGENREQRTEQKNLNACNLCIHKRSTFKIAEKMTVLVKEIDSIKEKANTSHETIGNGNFWTFEVRPHSRVWNWRFTSKTFLSKRMPPECSVRKGPPRKGCCDCGIRWS